MLAVLHTPNTGVILPMRFDKNSVNKNDCYYGGFEEIQSLDWRIPGKDFYPLTHKSGHCEELVRRKPLLKERDKNVATIL